MMKPSRRLFMQLAAAGAAASLFPSMRSRSARADSGIPKRILFVYGMGSIQEFYAPLPTAGNTAPTETAFQMGPLYPALAPWQSELIILDGIDMLSENVDPTGPYNSHVNGGTHALTAANRLTSQLSSGVSIDQYIAAKLNAPSPVTKYPMIEGDMGGTADNEGGPSYVASGEVNPRYTAPDDVAKLFPSGLGATAAEQAAAAAKLVQQKSAMDYALAEYSSLQSKLSKADGQKLAQHAQTLQDLESQLSIGVSASCEPPDATMTANIKSYDGLGGSGQASAAGVLQKADIMSRLFASAMSCDLTRVGLLHMPTHYDLEPVIGYTANVFGTNDSHDLTHKTASLTDPNATLWNNPDAMAMIKKVHTNQAQLLANLLGYLKAVPESDGSTLLDHTIVVWCSQIAQGGHRTTNLPWMIAGGGSTFRLGRYVKFDRGTKDVGPPHNNLFVSLANAMGIQTDTFGNPAVCTGPLAGLT